MNKELFNYLYSFKYKEKEYIYLINKQYPFYFLEYNPSTNNFEYPDIDTYKELYNKFYSNEQLLPFNMIEEIKTFKTKLHNKTISLVPLIRTTSGLLTLVMALSLCGCKQTDKVNQTTNTESSSIVATQGVDQEIKNYFKQYNMDVTSRDYNDSDYIFVTEFINNNNKKQITLHTFDDFRKYCNISTIPTWDEVINAFKRNQNIDQEKLNIILEGINNMKNNPDLKNIDLSVLYVNAQKMKFKYCTSEEMINTVGKDSVYAYFDVVSGTVYLPSDKPLEKFEFENHNFISGY